jgi:hypothetical protein
MSADTLTADFLREIDEFSTTRLKDDLLLTSGEVIVGAGMA